MSQDITIDYWNHETRIRLLEELNNRLETKLDRMDAKIDSHFHWTIGAIITILIATISIVVGIH